IGEKGQYLRESHNREKARQATVIGQNNGQDEEENWLVFDRPVSVSDVTRMVKVEVAFKLETTGKDRTESIAKIKDSPLVVYFPTQIDTRFGFLVQGPYDTVASRSDIEDNDWNKALIQKTAVLLTEALWNLKEMGLLTVPLLEALPIRMGDFPDTGRFYPIVLAVHDAFMNEELLPADDGTFVSARNAKLASADWLRKLLQDEQLRQLFKAENTLKWISGEITERAKNDLWKYVRDGLKVEEIRPEKFVELLTDDFLENQDDKWIIDFYAFLGKDRADLWKKSDAPLRKRKIIRLEDNSHVIPFKSDGTPNAYIPSSVSTNFPTIKRNIFADESAADFLKGLGIIGPDLFAEIIEFILPKYAERKAIIDHEENIDDLKKIRKLLDEPLQGNPLSSPAKAKILLGKLSLSKLSYARPELFKKFLNFIEVDPQESIPFLLSVVLPFIPFLKASNGSRDEYKFPTGIYKNTPELHHYFQDNHEAWFICGDYPDELLPLFDKLNINEQPKVTIKLPVGNGFVPISELHSKHERGLKGFDPDANVDGLENAITNPTIHKSAFIWNTIAIKYSMYIRGIVEKSSKKTYEKSKKETKFSNFGRLLIDTAWLPSPNSGFEKPSKLFLNDLPITFEKDTPLAQSLSLALGMKQPEREQALEVVTGGDPDLKMLIEHFQSASDDERKKILKTIPRENPPEPAPSFKAGLKDLGRPQRGIIEHNVEEGSTVSSPHRYQEKLNEVVEAGVEMHSSTPRTIKCSPVRDLPLNVEARRFLYEEYHGRCQITGVTFPKAYRNTDGVAENYFEACSLLPYKDADYLNNAGNMLCVSADTMAKFKCASYAFLDSFEDIIESLKNSNEQIEKMTLRISLAGEECSITWSQRHFMRLVALWDMT
ncbi:MAG: hypothetical protein C0399_13080, partial [Syntrophus sp. (in: bacteria)]|nr:hypothetical protein [Syntrophus sp. (in: bacteria)]